MINKEDLVLKKMLIVHDSQVDDTIGFSRCKFSSQWICCSRMFEITAIR